MNRFFPFVLSCLTALCFTGCLTTPVADSSGGITVTNTNVNAIMAAATSVFANSGYTPGPGDYPTTIAFDKPGGAFSQAMWGSYGQKQTIRCKVRMTPIPGTSNYRISAQAYTVTSAGEAGFEDAHKLMFFSGQFTPLLRQVQSQASNAGSGN